MAQVIINGHVVFAESRLPASDVLIELWDGGDAYGLISSVTANKVGAFSFIVPDPLGALIGDDTITPSYKIYSNGKLIPDPVVAPKGEGIEIVLNENKYDIAVPDPAKAVSANTFLQVEGFVTDLNGVPAANVTLHLYENKFGDNTLIATVVPDLEGFYRVKVSLRNINNSGLVKNRSFHIEVEDAGSAVVLVSRDLYIPTRNDVIKENLKIESKEYSTSPIYEVLRGRVSSVLGATMSFEDFAESIDFSQNEGDSDGRLSYIAATTGYNISSLKEIIKAYHFSEESGIPHDLLFALVRTNNIYINPLYALSEDQLRLTVQTAMDENVIVTYGEAEIDDFILAVKDWQVSATNDTPILDEDYSIGTVINNIFGGATAESDTIDFLTRYNSKEYEDINDFWEEYITYDAVKAEKAKRGLKIAGIAGFQPKIISHLMGVTTGGIHVMAEWTEAEWITLIDTVCDATSPRELCVPKSIIGDSDDQEAIIELYARKLKSLSQDMFPLTALKVKMSDSETGPLLIEDNELRPQVISFIGDNPDFDLRIHSIYDITEESEWDTRKVDDLEGVQQALAPFQRLLRVVGGHPDAAAAMKMDGIDSATAMMEMPQAAFAAKYANSMGGSQQAFAAYANGATVATYASNQFVNILQQWNSNSYPVFPWGGQTVGPHADPNLATLFGNMNYCACEQCLSLYSPAAYYTDILHFIKPNVPIASLTALTNELKRRRPDLMEIDLTCKNTNTPVPYIDLVIELLERLVINLSGGAPPFVPLSYQTNGTAKELAAYPEHVYKVVLGGLNYNWEYQDYEGYKVVYDPNATINNLTKALYPFNLPFNMGLEESRTYLGHMGAARYQLLKIFKPFNVGMSTGIDDADIFCEWLGISTLAGSIITNTHVDSTANRHKFYGFASASVTNYLDPSDSSVLLSGNWMDLLVGRMDIMTHQLRISYKDFLQFLTTDFLNKRVAGVRQITVTSTDVTQPDTCDLKKLKLDFVGGSTARTTFLDKLHRMIRFWHTGKFSIEDLDKLFTSANVTVLNAADFLVLGRIVQAAERLRISFKDVTGWWGNVDIHRYVDYGDDNLREYPSVYDMSFNNRAVINTPLPEFTDPNNITVVYEGYTAQIAASLGIKEEELFLILEYMNIDQQTDVVTLPVLSRIHSLSKVSKSIKVSMRDILTISFMMGIDIPEINTAYTIDERLNHLGTILDAVDSLTTSPFSVDEVVFLVQDYKEAFTFPPVVMQTFYESLRNELNKFPKYSSDVSALDNLTNIIYQFFSKEFKVPSSWVATIIENSMQTEDLVVETLLSDDFYSNTDVITLDGNTLPGGMYDILYSSYWLFYKVISIANKLKLNNYEFVYLYVNAQEVIGFDYTSLPIPYPPYTPSGTPNTSLFRGMLQLARWIDVKNKMSFVDDDLVRLLEAAKDLDPAPFVTASDPAGYQLALNNKFAAWKSIVNREEWGTMLDDLIGSTVTVVTWSPQPAGLLNAKFPKDYLPNFLDSIVHFWNIIKAVSWCQRTGLKPVTLTNALNRGLTLNDAHQVLLAAKAKHTEEGWLTVAKPLRDVLRMKQRDALVNFLLAYPTQTAARRWRNENDLFAYLLIDVEMEPCMATSRIKQAISSVQLYIDRVLLGLEFSNGNPASPIHIDDPSLLFQWKQWRKWYRIWEANRKVFLYPENWIEPDLRDNKSVFFEEMETKLMEGDVTVGAVEAAMSEYLLKLKDVAKLEPVGSVDARDSVTGKIINHAFARTYGEPHQFYYRRLVEYEWTPWERVEVEIKSKHISPMVMLNRLYLFWFTFREKKVPANQATINNIWANQGNNNNYNSPWFYNDLNRVNDDTPNDVQNNTYPSNSPYVTQIEITLNWSEYKDGKWQEHKVGADKMNLDINPLVQSYMAEIFDSSHNNAFPVWMGTSVKPYYNFLSKNRSLNVTELIISKIFPYAVVLENGGAAILVQFYNRFFNNGTEVGHNIHTFEFSPFSQQASVWRNIYAGVTFVYPGNTSYMDNKLVYNPHLAQGLQPDKLYVDNHKNFLTNNYVYIEEKTWTNFNNKERTTSAKILNASPNGAYKLTARQNARRNLIEDHFFYEDDRNIFFVRAVEPKTFPNSNSTVSLASAGQNAAINYLPGSTVNTVYGNDIHITNYYTGAQSALKYFFQVFYHADVDNFIKAMNSGGMDGFMNLANQDDQTDTLQFVSKYQPAPIVYNSYPSDKVDFDFVGAYSSYNWELFFHTPLMIAQRLMDNQQFSDAQKWFHYIFDPTSNVDANNNITGSKQRFWKFKPFYNIAGTTVQTLTDLLIEINNNSPNALIQVHQWENNPFKPHAIARIRILAYMKNVVMKYLDNLIAWGDQLYKRDTIESINEATQMYIIAANILGEKPQEVPKRAETGPRTFTELDAAGLDAFSNALVAVENYIDPNSGPLVYLTQSYPPGYIPPKGAYRPIKMFYFCLPNNPKLLAYWDTVADRLFKIRNCMNITGQVRQLPLFEPPIDPALLVRAAAAGLDISSVLNDLSTPPMPYKFLYMLQKANEICNDVKGLGSALLSALEKKDAEAMALLRSGLEITLLETITSVKKTAIDEASANIEALHKSKDVVQTRYNYYSSRPYKISREEEHIRLLKESSKHQARAGNFNAIGAVLSIIPEINIQAPFALGPSFGGRELSALMSALSARQSVKATIKNTEASNALTEAGYIRRMDDWRFQAESALKEMVQIDKQIIASEIRKNMAEKELKNHEVQIANAKEMDEYMRSKYTNQELYNWMITQISTSYFQAYQLAFDIAKRAEKCLMYELPLMDVPGTGFIRFGYWDSLRKGLLSGEKLQYDLRKIEIAYLESNTRELELTKHVSLALEDPMQLLALRETGSCSIVCDDMLFDLDYPGHYFRRIKSISVSLPCITGPYTTIAAQLSQSGAEIKDPIGDPITVVSTNAQIFTSSAQNDSGTFELNFKDERYLPFEGQGAICTWLLTLVGEEVLRQFDYSTISDVILHIKYTARYDSSKESTTKAELQDALSTNGVELQRYFSLKHEFANEWFAYSNAVQANDPDARMVISLDEQRFPFLANNKTINVTEAYVQARVKPSSVAGSYDMGFSSTPAGTISYSPMGGTPLNVTAAMPITIEPDATEGFAIALKDVTNILLPVAGDMDAVFDDAYLVLTYTLED